MKLLLHDARIARLVFANPVQRLFALSLSAALQNRNQLIRRRWLAVLRRGRWGRVSPWRRRRAVPGQLARLGATDADVRVGRMELGSAERYGQVEGNDLVTD
jgi:hypothetical protein